jgi:putative tryptophan/tyrosine transport system substrate-binding protein
VNVSNGIIHFAVGALLLALSFTAEAQQARKVPRIGYLSLASQPGLREEAFIQGLRDLGWVDGQSIASNTVGPQGT